MRLLSHLCVAAGPWPLTRFHGRFLPSMNCVWHIGCMGSLHTSLCCAPLSVLHSRLSWSMQPHQHRQQQMRMRLSPLLACVTALLLAMYSGAASGSRAGVSENLCLPLSFFCCSLSPHPPHHLPSPPWHVLWFWFMVVHFSSSLWCVAASQGEGERKGGEEGERLRCFVVVLCCTVSLDCCLDVPC